MNFFDLDPKAKEAKVRDMFGLDTETLEHVSRDGQAIVIAFSSQFPPKLIIAKKPRLDLVNADAFAAYSKGAGWLGSKFCAASIR